MSRSVPGPRTLAAGVGALAVAALLVALAGCGSAADDPTTGTTSADDAASTRTATPSESPSAGKAPGDTAKTSRQSGHGELGAGSHRASEAEGLAASDHGAAFNRAMKSCPAGLPRAQCEALVRGAAQSQHAQSHPVEEPGDCLDAMSKTECEALLTAEKAASQSGGSINVEECLHDPTPACEKVLRAAFGAQLAAREAGN